MKRPLNIIMPALGFVRLPVGSLLARAWAVHDGMSGNTAYPSPPVSMSDFKITIDTCSAAQAATLDGGLSATAARNRCREDLIVMLRSLGHYVSIACKGDTETFMSSGFVPVSTAHRIPEPLPPPASIRIDQGQTGQLLVRIEPVANARTYDLRYAKAPGSGIEPDWIEIKVVSTKPPIEINHLTPAGIYVFQAKAFGKLGYSPWSSTFQRMCI